MRPVFAPLLASIACALACGGSPAVVPAPTAEGVLAPGRLSMKVSVDVPVDVGNAEIPFTAEPWSFNVDGAVPDMVESDLFGTGLQIDLDGDGETTSTLDVNCRLNGDLSIGSSAFRPLAVGDFTEMHYPGNMTRIDSGAYVAHYGCGPTVSFGLSADPIDIERTPGPAVLVALLDRQSGELRELSPPQVRDVRVDGVLVPTPDLFIAKEMNVSSANGAPKLESWIGLTWFHVEVGSGAHDVSFVVTGERVADLVVLMSTTWSVNGDDRHRTDRAVWQE